MPKPIEFKGQTDIIAKDQPEYIPLPAFIHRESDWGEVISCWKLSFWERITLLFTGRLWLTLLTFRGPVQPQIIEVDTPSLVKEYAEYLKARKLLGGEGK